MNFRKNLKIIRKNLLNTELGGPWNQRVLKSHIQSSTYEFDCEYKSFNFYITDYQEFEHATS